MSLAEEILMTAVAYYKFEFKSVLEMSLAKKNIRLTRKYSKKLKAKLEENVQQVDKEWLLLLSSAKSSLCNI